ncbi:MAG: PEP-CTERM sorting domain-containing protein [Oceanipulchritudo sp.]
MKKNSILLTSLVGLFLSLTITAHSAIIAYEGFDFTDTDGGITGSGSGFGWSGGWVDSNNLFKTISPSLSIGQTTYDNQSTGVRVIADLLGAGVNLSRSLANAIPSTSTTFVSFMFDYNRTQVTENVILNFNGGDSGQSRFMFSRNDADGAKTDVSVRNGSTWISVATALSFNIGNSNLYIIGLDEAANDIKIWINPTVGGSDPATITTSAIAWSGASSIQFTSDWNNLELDEFRIGTTFADVTPVPEPATFALFGGFATLGLVLARRRRLAA